MTDYRPTGVLAAPILPISADGHTIDEPGLRRLVGHLASTAGITGVVVNAIAGEGPLLSSSEAEHVIRIASSELNGSLPVLAGLRAESPQEARERVAQFAAAGAQAVLLQAPADFARGVARAPEVALHYFGEVCAGDLPLIVFQHQVQGGRSYATDLLLDILALPGVVAVKETTFDVASYERDIRAIRAADLDVSVLCANDTLLLPCLAAAPPDGMLLGLASLVPELVIELWDASVRNDFAAARAAYDRLWPVVSTIYADPPIAYYARAKTLLQELGRISTNHLRSPLTPLQGYDRDRVIRMIDTAGLRHIPKTASTGEEPA